MLPCMKFSNHSRSILSNFEPATIHAASRRADNFRRRGLNFLFNFWDRVQFRGRRLGIGQTAGMMGSR